MATVRQKVMLHGTEPMQFILDLEEAIRNGARIDSDVYPRLAAFPHSVGLYVEGPADNSSWHWASTARLNCYPIPEVNLIYTEETIAELDWDTFREVVRAVGVKGRDRTKMTKEYFAALENKSEEVAE